MSESLLPETSFPSELLVLAALAQLRSQPGTVVKVEAILLLALTAIRGEA